MLKKILILVSLFAFQAAEAAPMTNGWIRNKDISPSAAIAYSKLNLLGSILNADINAAAAIAYSKLNLAGSILNADINTAAAIAYSKLNLLGSILNADISPGAAIAYSKLNLAGSILNADINASAAIAYSKLNLSASLLNGDIASNAAIAVSKLAAENAYTILGNNTGSSSTPLVFTVTQFADMMRARVSEGATIAGTDIDWSTANYHSKTLTAGTTFTFSNQRVFQCIMIDITNTTSNYVVTWPASVRWGADTTPTVTTGSKTDSFNCCYNGIITKCAVQQNFRPN